MPHPKPFRIRAVTAGLTLESAEAADGALAGALEFLRAARAALEGDGYEVQFTRLATQPVAEYLPGWWEEEAIGALARLDERVASAGAILSIGPVTGSGAELERFPGWAAELLGAAGSTSLSLPLLGGAREALPGAARAAGRAMLSISRATPGGEGNFRFAAAAGVPPGTPFFPVAYHRGAPGFALCLELPPVLRAALDGFDGPPAAAGPLLAGALERALRPLARRCDELGRAGGLRFGGIDVSPAPGLDASIGAVIEALTGRPFGEPSTLAACAAITSALRALQLPTCGYSGLMLPVLEDPVLARRAAEGRFGVAELLLYSAVCGTGLDVVPLPGGLEEGSLAALLEDVAALAARMAKPLSARLFPLPGRRAGDRVRFDNPYLTEGIVMGLPGHRRHAGS